MGKHEKADRSDNHHTYDGVEITANLRVFTNDWKWGNVRLEQFEPKEMNRQSGSGINGEHFDGWYKVTLDSGGTTIYNGTRMWAGYRIGTPDPTPDKRI